MRHALVLAAGQTPIRGPADAGRGRPAILPAVLRRTGVAGLSCRRGGVHVVETARLRIAVAWFGNTPEIYGLLDDVAAYWQGYSVPPTMETVHPDGTVRRLPMVQAVQMCLAIGHNPLMWHVDMMEFLARDRRTAVPIASISLYRGPSGGYQIGGTVAATHRGRGYGREALETVCAIAHQHLGIAQLNAGCEKANLASRRWLSSCGFTPVAGPPRHTLPNGRIIESCWWRRSAPSDDRCRNRPSTAAPPQHTPTSTASSTPAPQTF